MYFGCAHFKIREYLFLIISFNNTMDEKGNDFLTHKAHSKYDTNVNEVLGILILSNAKASGDCKKSKYFH